MNKLFFINKYALSLPYIIVGMLFQVPSTDWFCYKEISLTFGVIFMVCQALYIYSIVDVLNKVSSIKYNISLFRIALLLGSALFVCAPIMFYVFDTDKLSTEGVWQLIVFIAFGGFVYAHLFTARLIKTLETKKSVPKRDSVLLAIGLMFFPFNILFVHNRVKQIILSYNTVEAA